ncbi:ATP-dependent helicase [Canibacter sp. lx-45]|uniref:ATP-dependent helicase n=1 Tax=Canibacter zhuwentaonis TaxID=2837491 RepID=UPI001BDD14E4|nr:ATP-dependent helicase [Canibacter zhuwentaonis]MBT1034982.1 ATP-dependent helicase [Canibacter zhuwentaonis]
MHSKAEKILLELDDTQRQVAMCLRGPVAVFAGAGSGKTRTIIYRIAYAVASGEFASEQILALTYTRKAAAEMKTRLAVLGIKGVEVRTFHSLALGQLQHYWQSVIGGQNPSLVRNTREITARALERVNVFLSSAALADLDSEIKLRKTNMLHYETYEKLIGNKRNPGGLTPHQVVTVMREYERLKLIDKQIDSEDSIALITALIKSEEYIASKIHAGHRLITVDEYQDISALQQAYLDALLGKNRNLCVVGDVSQTIFSFAGAKRDYLLNFKRRYRDAKVFELTHSYRSSQQIISAANALMSKQKGSLVLRSRHKKNAEEVSCVQFGNVAIEYATIANIIRTQLRGERTASQIAILARKGWQLEKIADVLRAAGIPVKERDKLKFFERQEVKRVLLHLASLNNVEKSSVLPQFQIVTDVLRRHGWSPTKPQSVREFEEWMYLNACNTIISKMMSEGDSLATIVAKLHDMAAREYEPEIEAVTLSTIHSAKGLEWECVYLTGCAEGILPARQSLKHAHRIDEERRLAYVAFTRARTQLRISFSADSGGDKDASVSRFITEAQIPVLVSE